MQPPGFACGLMLTLGVFLLDSHLAAVEATAPAADDGGVGRAVGPKAGALLDHLPPVLAAAGAASDEGVNAKAVRPRPPTKWAGELCA